MIGMGMNAGKRKGPGKDGRHAGAMIAVVLLILAAIVIIGTLVMNRNEEKASSELQGVMTDPEMMLARFFQERSLDHPVGNKHWRWLLEFMSYDDRQWLERNAEMLADQYVKMNPSSMAAAETPEKQTYAALKQLIQFGPGAVRPVIVRVDTKDTAGTAFVHDPNRLETMREVQLVKESGQWKIRRFLGSRDSRPVMEYLIKEKTRRGKPLEADEQAYAANPQAYAEKKKNEL